MPKFDKNGNFLKGKDELTLEEFYSTYKEKGINPDLMLTAVTTRDGKNIYMLPIPKTASENQRVINLCLDQIFLHEFFHTAINPRICWPEEKERGFEAINAKEASELRRSIKFRKGTDEFTLEEWWNEFKSLVLSEAESIEMSRYSSNYFEDLKSKKPIDFELALDELMAETFTGYILNILPNKNESTGNTVTDFKKVFPKKWALMDRLCQAELIKNKN